MNNWSKALVASTDTFEMIIKSIGKSGMRIALVVDQENKLYGTVTDGDIRRALLRHVSLNSLVTDVMNSNPMVAHAEDDRNSLLKMMSSKDILHMPIIDKDGILCGLETLQHLIESPIYDNPIFLMAGGFGTRLKHLTKDTPKPLLKVGNRPILETILLQFIDAGFHIFFISIHYRADMVREYFGDGSKWGVEIQYVYESEPLGTAGALGLLPLESPSLPIVVMNGDLLTDVNFENLLDFHKEQGGLATMCVREYDFQVPYGVVTLKGRCIGAIKEQPIQKFFVNAGIYVLEFDILDGLSGESYLDMPNLFESHIKKGNKINAFPIHEYWLDIGRIEEYERANQDIRS